MNPAATHQPAPVKSDRDAIQDLVIVDLRAQLDLDERTREPLERAIEDIQARKEVGIKKYGTVLQAFNGRDALMDAYQEALDLAMYLRQVIEENPRHLVVVVFKLYDDALEMIVMLRGLINLRAIGNSNAVV